MALAGCGDSETASTTSSTTQATATVPQHPHESASVPEGKGNEADGSSPRGAEKERAPSSQKAGTVKVPPISSAPVEGSAAPAPDVETVKGGDNSVQSYGVEASELERTEAAIALQGYLNARLQEDWGRACSYLAQRPKAQLEKLSQQAKSQGKDLGDCVGQMEALGEGESGTQPRGDATITEVLSFRTGGDVPGDPSYLIFTGPPGSTLYSMPMYLEGEGWKVGLALAAELPV
ncbi:MAG: hypothetical protein ACRDLL_12295 [Solirubrobacterales bacterium]